MSNSTSNQTRWATLTAGDIMQTRVISIPYSAPLSEVERILSDNRISGAPVVDQSGRVIGVLSVRDILERYTEDPDSRPRRGRAHYHLTVADLEDEDFDSFEVPPEAEETAGQLMNAEVYTVVSTATVTEVARQMVDHRIHRVLVTDPETGAVCGLISSMGILAAVAA